MMQSVCVTSSDDGSDRAQTGYDEPGTPNDEAPHQASLAKETSDAESDEGTEGHAHGELVPRVKPGGYNSRIEQMLYEDPEMPIMITDAGKSQESGGKYIVYTIRTAVWITVTHSKGPSL